MEELRSGKLDGLANGIIPEYEPLSPEELRNDIYWNYDDFFLLAQGMHELAWGETIDNWSVVNLRYKIDCEQIESGNFQEFFIRFSRKTPSEFYLSSVIFINLNSNEIRIIKQVYYLSTHPLPFDLNKSLTINQICIKPFEAVLISDEDVGEKIRNDINNKCYLEVDLFGRQWVLTTMKQESSNSFSSYGQLQISAQSGEVLKRDYFNKQDNYYQE